jgi:hypothetical protein
MILEKLNRALLNEYDNFQLTNISIDSIIDFIKTVSDSYILKNQKQFYVSNASEVSYYIFYN